jgi:hypothetical protein
METKNIYKAISSIMNEVEPIGKNKKNQQQGFMYRGIDDMYNELQPLFIKYKVFITSEVLESTREERQSKTGGILLWTILKVKFTFFADDGSNVTSIMVGEAMDSADKSANKSMSVALKYCLMQLLLIPTEELKKDDPDGHIHEPAPKTTLYNHKEISTNEKPLIPNESFKKAMALVKEDASIYEKTKNKYTLTSFQDEQLYELAKQTKSKLQTA